MRLTRLSGAIEREMRGWIDSGARYVGIMLQVELAVKKRVKAGTTGQLNEAKIYSGEAGATAIFDPFGS